MQYVLNYFFEELTESTHYEYKTYKNIFILKNIRQLKTSFVDFRFVIFVDLIPII